MTNTVSRTLKVGVVGCGNVGTIHAQAYLNNPSVEFVGMCDLSEERLRARTGKLHVPAYGSIAALIEKGKPELVSVVVRDSALAGPVEECLEAGVHVLSEKPISFDPAVIWRLIQLAERRGIQFGVNFNQRFSPPSQWFRRLREEGAFGDMTYTLAQYNQGGATPIRALREHMIHQFDLWRYHLGPVLSVTAQPTRRESAKPDDIIQGSAGSVLFENDALGVFVNGFRATGGLVNYYELVGTRGRGFCENFVGRAVFRPTNGPACFKDPPWLGGGSDYWDTLPPHLGLVVEALLGGTPMPVPATAAFEAQCLCTALARSAETGRRVNVQDVQQEIVSSVKTIGNLT